MKFFDLFPTPRYLSLAEVGISISEREINFISFRHGTPGELKVEHFGSVALPEETILSGALNDSNSLVTALSKLKRDYGFRYVAVSLPEEKAYLFTTTVDKVSYKDLADAVAFTIEENVPTALQKSVYSFDVLPEGDKVKSAVSVLPIEVASAYAEAFKLAGLTPVSIDIEPQAVARALVTRGDARSHLIINLRDKKVGFYLVSGEVVQFSSTTSIDLTASNVTEVLRAEIKKFFIFWNTRLTSDGAGFGKIEQVILCGEGAKNESLTANIMSDVETPYTLANVWTNVSRVERRLPVMPFDQSLSYAGSIGAALPQSKQIYV